MTLHQQSLEWCKAHDGQPHDTIHVSGFSFISDYGEELLAPHVYNVSIKDCGMDAAKFHIWVDISDHVDPWMVNPNSSYYKHFLMMVGAYQPPLTTNEDKPESFWKQYAQQMRKELTDTQRELADLKEAYNGLCEAHAEAAEKLAETTDMPKLRENFEFAIEPFECHRRPPILHAFDFAVELTKRDAKHGKVSE